MTTRARTLVLAALAAVLAGLMIAQLSPTTYGSVDLSSVLATPLSSEQATPFDESPALANLDPALREALRLAATDAHDDGVRFEVNSGWRSPEHQERLLREAVAEHGSAAEAARWVATAETSPHVSGDAVDLGGDDATDWLSSYGSEYGLCQIYRNEPWHFELRPDAVDHGCPAMYDDPTHDPRMQR